MLVNTNFLSFLTLGHSAQNFFCAFKFSFSHNYKTQKKNTQIFKMFLYQQETLYFSHDNQLTIFPNQLSDHYKIFIIDRDFYHLAQH